MNSCLAWLDDDLRKWRTSYLLFGCSSVLLILSLFCFEALTDWNIKQNITNRAFTGFVFGCLMFPPGAYFNISFIQRLVGSNFFPPRIIAMMLGVYTFVWLAVGVGIYVSWGGFAYLTWSKAYDNTPLGPILGSVIFFFAIAVAVISAKLGYSVIKTANLRETSSDAEAQPLITSKQVSVFSPDPTVTRPPVSNLDCLSGDIEVILCFGFILPSFFLLCCLLPEYWTRMSPGQISNYANSIVHKGWVMNVRLTSSVVLHIRSYVLGFYIFITLLALAAYGSRKSLWFRVETQRLRFPPVPWRRVIVTQGEWLVWNMFTPFCVFWFLYFAFIEEPLHPFYNHQALQKHARAFGMVSVLFLSILVSSIARTSLWPTVFGLSYEHVVRFHKIFGWLFVITMIIHVGIWIALFSKEHILQSNFIFVPIPFSYRPVNFTNPFMYLMLVFIVFPAFCVLSLSYFRRNHYEIFYFTHLWASAIVAFAVLWHAPAAWYFLVPAILVGLFGFFSRFFNGGKLIRLKRLQAETSDVVCMEVLVSEERQPDEHVFGSGEFEFGQYYYVNIPRISIVQWHPFHAVSEPTSASLAFHIMKTQPGQWTTSLYNLGSTAMEDISDLEIHLDGPYGDPINIDGYRKIILSAAGIGITSYITFFSSMIRKTVRGESNLSVDLVWVAKSPAMFMLYREILSRYAHYFARDAERLLDIRLFYTGTYNPADLGGLELHEVEEELGIGLEQGRPDMLNILDYLDGLGSFTLICASGPQDFAENCENVAIRYKAHYLRHRFVS